MIVRHVIVLNAYNRHSRMNRIGALLVRTVPHALTEARSTDQLESPDRLLMPAFGTTAVRSMFDDMLDIASQLVLKWERYVRMLCCEVGSVST